MATRNVTPRPDAKSKRARNKNAVAVASPFPRKHYYPIPMPVGPIGLLCASSDTPQVERQNLASCLLDTARHLLVQFPSDEGDNRSLAYHVVWACSWLTALGQGLLDSLNVAKEGV